MDEATYSKHKDRAPEDTVLFIRETLAGIGLATELVWTSRQFGGTCSNHVYLAGTSLGENGKGTSEEYALASGHAELMERIQNKAIGRRMSVERSYREHGFYDFPDERLVSAGELVARHDPLMKGWLRGWGCTSEAEMIALAAELAHIRYRRSDDMLVELPFADVATGRLRWLSPALYGPLCGSNGMAAGNTLEECLVQGLSEVFERYVQRKVLRGEVTCPVVPREELDALGLGGLVARIEEGGRYQVRVCDGSLGRGYPVVVTAIIDRRRGSFGVNCGAHPSMAVAVERTLTEAFQARTVERFTGIGRLAPVREAASAANIGSAIHKSAGAYPSSLLVGEPSWEYRRWEPTEGKGNAELLRGMVALLRRDGYPLLVRDSSHLGFPSCHIIVPGMSEVAEPTPDGLAQLRAQEAFLRALDRFPTLDEDALGAIRAFRRMSPDPRAIRPGRPLRGHHMTPAAILAYLHLSQGEFAEAERCYRTLAEGSPEQAALYWQAMADYARFMSWGEGRERSLQLLSTLYPPAFARRAEHDTEGGSALLATHYPQLSCFDCERCEAAEAGNCLGLADQRAMAKIDAALARSTVSQVALLTRLTELLT